MQYPTTRYSLGSTKSSLPSISSIPSSSSVYIPYYDYYPHETIPLEQFQTLAMERLKILKCTEQALAKLNTTLTTASTTKTDEIEKLLRKELKEKLTYLKFIVYPSFTTSSKTDLTNDIISHYILRLAYCQNDEERRWFLTNEIELFRYRFNLMTKTEQLSYLKNSPNIKQFYDVVNDEQKQELKQELINSSSSFHYTHIQQTFDEVTYFRVRFQHVPDLVRLRRCYLRAGYAYISEHDIISFVLQQYRTSLSYQMTCASKKFHLMKKLDTRIASVLKVLGMKRTVGVTTTNFNENEQTETITYDMLDTLAKKSYPLCMRHLHEQMTKQHHLKHLGRLQYRLFLKGIGLSLDECLKFFRNEFVSNGSMNPTQFEREHVYNIRHAYGQEGKHTSYTPYSCVKIIQDPPPGVNEYHGCPYRHWDPNTLKQRLSTNYGIHDEQVLNEIVDRSQNHHYQIACQIYFEYQHNVKNHGIGINHPNQYFNESRKILTGGATASTKPTES